MTSDKVWKHFLTFVIQAMKQVVFTVNTEDFGSGGKNHYFQIREFRLYFSARHISKTIYTIPGKSFVYLENFTEFYNEVVHKRDDCNLWFGYQ